jgi:3-phenylpropionate/trans-cinnamate dioxygenase ferredoxin subunit
MAAERVAALSELQEATPHRVEAAGEPVVLVRLGDEVKALHDTCSHQEWSLAEGQCVGRELECALHGAMFSLDDGRPSSLPALKPVPTYAVTISGDDVLVDATTPVNGAPVPDHW